MRAKNNRFYDKSRNGKRSPVAGWRLSLGVALVLIAALLTGCRGNQMDTQGEEQQASQEQQKPQGIRHFPGDGSPAQGVARRV